MDEQPIELSGGTDVRGPRADADWSQATIKVTVPIHGTAMTTPGEAEVTLPELAAILDAMR